MKNTWFPLYYQDYINGTRELTPEERDFYMRFLFLMYDSGGPIADDEADVCARLSCGVRVWRRIRQRLLETGKIKLDGDRLYNSRAMREIEIQRRLSEQRALLAAKGGRKSGESRRQKRSEIHPVLESFEEVSPKFGRNLPANHLKTKESYELQLQLQIHSSTYPNGQVEQSGKGVPSPTREAAPPPSEHCSKPSIVERQSEPIDSPEASPAEIASAQIHQIRESRPEGLLVEFPPLGPSGHQIDNEQRPGPTRASARGTPAHDPGPTSNRQAIAACLAAAGPGLADPAREPVLHLSAPRIAAAIRAGCDLHEDIIPVIQSRTAKPRTNPITSWAYFERAWCDQRDRRLANLPAPDTARFSKEISYVDHQYRFKPRSAGEQRAIRHQAAIEVLRELGELAGPENLRSAAC